MKIETDGFLSVEAEKGKIHISTPYRDFLNYARELNRYSMALLTGLEIDWGNNHRLIINALFIRIVETFQGSFLLLEYGMMPESKILTRAMLEMLFNIVALQKKPDLLEIYLNQHKESHFRALKATLDFKSKPLKDAVRKYKLEQLYIKEKKERKGQEYPTLSPKGWAIEAELTDLYNVYYTTYSDSIHSNPSALDDHVDNNPDEINLSFGPSDKDLYDVLKCGCYVLINAVNSTALVHGQDVTKDLDIFVNKFGYFDEKYIAVTC